MSTTVKGTKGSRTPVDLFGAIDEAAEMVTRPRDLVTVPIIIRNTLRGVAGRTMFCERTGQVLDWSDVVVVTILDSEGRTSNVYALSPVGWAEAGEGMVALAQRDDIVEMAGGPLIVKVLTERHLRAAIRAAESA